MRSPLPLIPVLSRTYASFALRSLLLGLLSAFSLAAQQTAKENEGRESSTEVLNPSSVSSERDVGYAAGDPIAASRSNTRLMDYSGRLDFVAGPNSVLFGVANSAGSIHNHVHWVVTELTSTVYLAQDDPTNVRSLEKLCHAGCGVAHMVNVCSTGPGACAGFEVKPATGGGDD